MESQTLWDVLGDTRGPNPRVTLTLQEPGFIYTSRHCYQPGTLSSHHPPHFPPGLVVLRKYPPVRCYFRLKQKSTWMAGGEQSGHCSPCGRVLRTGLKLESNKQRSKCHHVQMGYRVSGGINWAQRAARPEILPVPGSWEVWFPEKRPKVPPDLWPCDDWLTGKGSHLLVRGGEENLNTTPLKTCPI